MAGQEETLEIEGYKIIITYHNNNSQLLKEANHRGKHLVGTFSVLQHSAHTNPGEIHLHVYNKNNQIFAINQSGSAHDGYHGVRIPNKVFKALKKQYPKFNFPKTQIIESIEYTFAFNESDKLTDDQIKDEIKILENEMNNINNQHPNNPSRILDKAILHQEVNSRYIELLIETQKRIDS